jgi:hypothetical protein
MSLYKKGILPYNSTNTITCTTLRNEKMKLEEVKVEMKLL